MTTAPLLTSRSIGETENALRAVLAKGLEGSGLDYHHWVALKAIAESRPAIDAASLRTLAQRGLKIDAAAVDALVDDLRARQFVAFTGSVLSLTNEGRAFYEPLSRRIGGFTREIFSDLNAEDLAAAHRVLTTIADRANQLLAS